MTLARFLTPLRMEDINGRTVRLIAPLRYQTDVAYLGVIHVPEGFITDFASVPRGLWNLFPPQGEYSRAAVVHDFLYRCTDVERRFCDAVFLEAMRLLGVGWFTRRLMYRAVRLFGGRARKKMEAHVDLETAG